MSPHFHFHPTLNELEAPARVANGEVVHPAAYVAKAKEHGLDPTAFKSSIAALGVDLTATMTQIRNIARANPDAFAKENDTNFAQMLFKVFTGASEVPAHALGCRCAGGVMRRLCLVSAKMQREISDSDCADLWHSFYAPYVDVSASSMTCAAVTT